MLNLQLTADLATCLTPRPDSGQRRGRSVTIYASDWPGVVTEVRTRFPDLANRIFAENGTIQQGFLVAVNSEVVDVRAALSVRPGDELFVFPQISGG
jgi:molybdopterin converting factor small subunit